MQIFSCFRKRYEEEGLISRTALIRLSAEFSTSTDTKMRKLVQYISELAETSKNEGKQLSAWDFSMALRKHARQISSSVHDYEEWMRVIGRIENSITSKMFKS
jgi:hypothetical protein